MKIPDFVLHCPSSMPPCTYTHLTRNWGQTPEKFSCQSKTEIPVLPPKPEGTVGSGGGGRVASGSLLHGSRVGVKLLSWHQRCGRLSSFQRTLVPKSLCPVPFPTSWLLWHFWLPGSGWVWQGCALPSVQGEQPQQRARLWMRIQTKPKHLEILPLLTPNTFDMLKHALYSVRNQMAVLRFQIIRSILLDD